MHSKNEFYYINIWLSKQTCGIGKEPVQLSRESLHVQDLVARKLTGISGTTLVYR